MAEDKVFGYARCSKSEQAEGGYSIDYQKDLLVRAGVSPDDIFVDVCSSVKTSRPGFDALMSAVRGGDKIVVYRLDRMGRSMKHLVDTLETLEAKGVQLQSLSEGIDTTTAAGRAFYGMAAVFAQFERDLLSERTKEGLRAARRKGHTGGRPKTSAKTVERMLKQYDSSDYSVREIAQMNGISVSTLYRYVNARKETDTGAENRP